MESPKEFAALYFSSSPILGEVAALHQKGGDASFEPISNPKCYQFKISYCSLLSELMHDSISSSVFPLVSGTNFATNRIVNKENPEYM